MIRHLLGRGLEGLSIVLLLGLMIVTGLDVIGRYFLNAPFRGAFELTEILLAALVLTALPLVSRAGEHVDVDIATSLLPGGMQRVLSLIVAVLCAGTLLVFAWRLGLLAQAQATDGARSEAWGIPYAPLAFLGAAMCALAAVYGIIKGAKKSD
jgi:TRAP-type C4-dicarboxylate transport system permease small subunit